MQVELLEIVSNKEIAHNIYEMVLKGEMVSSMNRSGQFLHLRMNDPNLLLRRPISIASIDEDTCTLLYRIVGKGTKDMSRYQVGDFVDTLGPLGNGFHFDFLSEEDQVCVIGGGIGVAPLYELGKELVANGNHVTFILGFANQDDIYYYEQFQELGKVILCTDDGSAGLQGHVGVALDQVDPTAVFACGPTPLLRLVQSSYSHLEHVYLSLEERMACGIGACYGCDTKKKDKRTCKDGPVFQRKEVVL
ncbi:dihydroorotate dehydrogenase electron transfer subunit [Jeotgalibaca ciconiae]|uniref:Dihydroorotate dehydrogenase B (NAD(+)), electron transfer subunit n=1 Tax=Jeotgalibaca ciconiae TaxID=2496265 RepID=A0A3S9HAI6_9LACT|nr:dihydroorotate dehydrogenase electron transfer subunit [Jeotgalibaca ciconiae]AZP04378.1 dihydroorotate dehydrogenase electron transfer subunit [Jeotgalibaca ciconiae]